jgi:hypothetical protein
MKRKNILIEKYIEPSEVVYFGTFFTEYYYNRLGELHSFLGQPAEVFNYNKSEIRAQRYYKRNKIHRDCDQPAIIEYTSGRIDRQYWLKEGNMHRANNKPAGIYYKNNKIEKQWFFENGIEFKPIKQNFFLKFLKIILKKFAF